MKDQKKRQRRYYSGKKKKHTQKTQVIASTTGKILSVKIDKGRVHDFKLFKKSKKIIGKISSKVVLADLGYLGIKNFCPYSILPKKRTKSNPLTKEDKKDNRILSTKRVLIEQINAKIKVFKITKYPYRNRRKRFGLRMNLICAIINLDLKPLNRASEGML